MMNTQSPQTPVTQASPRRAVRSALAWVVTMAIVTGICALFLKHGSPRPQPAIAGAAPAGASITYEAAVAQMAAAPAPARPAAATITVTPDASAQALARLVRVDRLLRDYLRRCGEFPIGTNADITRALRGANPHKVIFVTPDEAPMNDAGELLDGWGTPLFFHQVSGTRMEILSAGPDRRFWTADDAKVVAN